MIQHPPAAKRCAPSLRTRSQNVEERAETEISEVLRADLRERLLARQVNRLRKRVVRSKKNRREICTPLSRETLALVSSAPDPLVAFPAALGEDG